LLIFEWDVFVLVEERERIKISNLN